MTPQAKYLKDYSAPSHVIDEIALTFELAAQNTRVTATSKVRANTSQTQPLVLDGMDLTLLEVQVNHAPYHDYQLENEQLIVNNLPQACELTIITQISPATNQSLEGLYLSDGAYCTQCEAEGFRKITYFLDRPDVMAVYTVKIIADKADYPYLLSNGNKIDEGELENYKHFATWHDPFPKPCYLFALVAGQFDVLQDTYTTASGREVTLTLYVDKGNLDKTAHAMQSLKKAMKWDEQRFNLQYDLDIYMIVAVDFFNMGAMENKGLNIFNSKCVLANQKTATDRDFHTIESIVGHEYFHNWTGNRVTCRDWFQLSLKEGLTVFRDQEFSSDLGSRALNRIDAVKVMRTHQFSEDAGPMAHPIRPEKVIEMNNFYTVTVYDKGAEVIRMMHTLLGEEGFMQGMKLYFERHDGQAVTCDDFVNAMADANQQDLTQFKHWYSQSGTPVVNATAEYDSQQQRYALTLTQTHPATADQSEKTALHIPIKIELLSPEGKAEPLQYQGQNQSAVLNLTQTQQTFYFDTLTQCPVCVLGVDFSAPVKTVFTQSQAELLHIMRFASSDFSRWDAQQQLFSNAISQALVSQQQNQAIVLDKPIKAALAQLIAEPTGDLALLAELLTLPSFDTLASQYNPVPVDELCEVIAQFEQQLALHLAPHLTQCLTALETPQAQQQQNASSRALIATCLYYLARLNNQDFTSKIAHYANHENMTLSLAALRGAVKANHVSTTPLMEAFEQRWQHDVLVMDKWFMLQAQQQGDGVIKQLKSLYQHPCFTLSNPNRVRALVGTFCALNMRQFHRKDGLGYQLLGDLLVELNSINPQNASRLITPLMSWQRFDETRQQLMKAQLMRLQVLPNLSKDLYEKVAKALD